MEIIVSDHDKRRKRRLTVPREQIEWYPAIDPDLCNSCSSCFDFCPKEVFASGPREEGLRCRPKMTVAEPYRCIVLCSACERICAAGAISFPPSEAFEHLVEYTD
ncbi:4Fe-4S ferredoxin iron-sulfur binding domain protein [Chlorobium limicola DSM 245]|uniref:4Fe-4S ferredoxin iron-sulfur binding domain protein n=1 Tax=Chlorobium limicola (strain DSM 245 / NBRC 103803 / 6330) TaxID=290315 RepID=B3EC03_CHLL2|nr:ferredoxin family protein [Chlorobium limicola]ACD90078.1 4Fe-4S ferredoxin iron-sulfur binding domain protein [Chlorobium limicola DSM 245]